VTGIERLSFSLEAVTDRVRALDDQQTRFVIDAEGSGTPCGPCSGGPIDDEHWQLYAGRGIERRALVDELLVATQEARFHFAPALAE
jgi:hypothetical protein